MSDLTEKEARVDQYIQQGDREAAVKGLYELIVAHARNKDFPKAEALRERLYDVDAMALTEIVRSGEIIEEEKSQSMDQDHREIWNGLYGTLSQDEANALYFAMEASVFETDQPLFRQGDKNTHLYFIDEGEVKVTYVSAGRENLLKTLGPGDIIGQETFFSRTAYCTASAFALSHVKVNFLGKDKSKPWQESFPHLESKLLAYCSRLEQMKDTLKAQDLDRRTQKRVQIEGRLLAQILDGSGKPVGKPFKGSFSDISVGGLAFIIRISRKETAHLLLGRNLNLKFLIPLQGAQRKVNRIGKVIGIQAQVFGDYSIHVRFKDLMEKDLIEVLDGLAEPAVARAPELELKLDES